MRSLLLRRQPSQRHCQSLLLPLCLYLSPPQLLTRLRSSLQWCLLQSLLKCPPSSLLDLLPHVLSASVFSSLLLWPSSAPSKSPNCNINLSYQPYFPAAIRGRLWGARDLELSRTHSDAKYSSLSSRTLPSTWLALTESCRHL